MASVSPTRVWAEEKGAKIVHSTLAKSTAVQVSHPLPRLRPGPLIPSGESGDTRTVRSCRSHAGITLATDQAPAAFPRTVRGTGERRSLFIYATTKPTGHDLSRFTKNPRKTQRGYGTCPKSHSQWMARPRSKASACEARRGGARRGRFSPCKHALSGQCVHGRLLPGSSGRRAHLPPQAEGDQRRLSGRATPSRAQGFWSSKEAVINATHAGRPPP